jgi:hypothetical protein
MGLLALAAFNAMLFHKVFCRSLSDENVLPVAAKTAAVISLVLWISIIACGRLLAY